MTRRAAPVLPFSGPNSPNLRAVLFTFGLSLGRRRGGNNSGNGVAICPSVLLFDIFGGDDSVIIVCVGLLLEFSVLELFGLLKTLSVAERVIEFLDGVFGFSFFFVRMLDPGALPMTLTLLVVVFCLDKLSGLAGDEFGDGPFVVVKNPNTLSATILILALALLCVFDR
jgi:hypothetical protein